MEAAVEEELAWGALLELEYLHQSRLMTPLPNATMCGHLRFCSGGVKYRFQCLGGAT